MRDLTDRIMRDQEYWRGKGITINAVGPMHDGSSVEVYTAQGDPDQTRAFAARYGEGKVSVRGGTSAPIAPTGGSPFTPPPR